MNFGFSSLRGRLAEVRWALLVLAVTGAAAADAPSGRYVISGGTVTDTVTGLIWQQATVATTYTFADAQSYCAGLTLGGSSSWRAPSLKELQTIIDRSRVNPCVDTTAFPGTASAAYWSSTLYANNTAFGWYVAFGVPFSSNAGVAAVFRVRCVR